MKNEQYVIDKLLEDGRGITIKEGTYISMSKKASFIHPIYGEWEATPKNVLYRKTTHPIESNILRSSSNKETKLSEDYKEKLKQNNIEKTGYSCCLKDPKTIEKIKQTNLKKYGYSSVLSSPEHIKKGKQTRLEKYGNEKYTNKEKIKQTNLRKYGYENPVQNPEIIKKILKTKEDRGYITRPKGLSWEDYAESLNVPRTSMQSFINDNGGQWTEELEKQFLSLYNNNVSNIENIVISNMQLTRYNSSVNSIGPKYRPDFILNNDTYLNADGLYWHSDKVKEDKYYHFNMRKQFEDNNLMIFQFRADEIEFKLDIVKSIVNNKIGLSSKIYARQCSIKEVNNNEACVFLQNNHLMGKINAKHIGLYFNDELVTLLSYKNYKNALDISRFCHKLNITVVGGMSKLIKYIERNIKPSEITCWIDLRYGTGKHMKNIGFIRSHDVLSWKWTDFKHTYNRRYCMATKELTEQQNAELKKICKIYDAGQRLFIKRLKDPISSQ